MGGGGGGGGGSAGGAGGDIVMDIFWMKNIFNSYLYT